MAVGCILEEQSFPGSYQRKMSPNFIQEQMSWAFVRAVVFRAGYRLSLPVVDDHGIDGTIESYGGGLRRVDFQLKATTQFQLAGSSVGYDLRVANYNQLIREDDVPRVLILLLMPGDDTQWLIQSEDQLCLRKCAYWADLMGKVPSTNTSTVRIHIPTVNMFDQTGLQSMFSQMFRSGAL